MATSSQCVYCGSNATTRDHVPPRFLLDRPFPPNLHTVPSCASCNQGASLDEQYLLTLLGQVSHSPLIISKAANGGSIAKTLERSPGLFSRIFDSFEFDEDDGRMLIRPEMQRVNAVIRKIATGLFVLRYGRVPASTSVGPVGVYQSNANDDHLPYFITKFTERFGRKQWRIVQPDVFSYIFVRDPKSSSKVWCVMDIHRTLWGVAHLPNPKSAQIRSDPQFWLS